MIVINIQESKMCTPYLSSIKILEELQEVLYIALPLDERETVCHESTIILTIEVKVIL